MTTRAICNRIVLLTERNTMTDNETFKISYYAEKHKKFIERRGKWTEKSKYWFSKAMKPCITYFDIDANNYRTATGSYWIKRGN